MNRKGWQGASMGNLEQHFAHFPRELQDILFAVRDLVFEIRPEANERVDLRGLSYFDERIGGTVKGAIAIAHIADDHIQVHLIHGAVFPDPKGMLEGGLDAKYKRFASLYSMEATDWQALGDLIRAQIDYIEKFHR